MGGDDTARIDALNNQLGQPAVRWMLAIADDPTDGFSDQQHEVLGGLERITLALALIQDPYQREIARDHLLLTYEPGLGTSRATHFHKTCGGSMPSPASTQDEVTASVAALAADLYVQCLFPPSQMWHGTGPSRRSFAMFKHPMSVALQKGILADADLSRLFPDASPDVEPVHEFSYEVGSHVMWSSGSGGSLSVNQLPSSLVDFTYALNIICDRPFDAIGTTAEDAVARARRLATGEWVPLPVVSGVSNMSLGSPVSSVPLGDNAALFSASGKTGLLPVIDGASTAILLVEQPVKLLMLGPWPSGDNDADWERLRRHNERHVLRHHRGVQRALSGARLAFVLGSSEDATAAPVAQGTMALNPLAGGGTSWSTPPPPFAALPAVEIDAATAGQATAWAARVGELSESLWFGARRLLSAVAGRSDAIDSFVDAVICWENMFGADTEITTTLSMAIARLLEPSDEQHRRNLFEGVRTLYGIRSGIVHGDADREPAPEKAYEYRDRAISIAVKSMRALFDKPALLNAKTSSARAQSMLLG